MAKIIPKTSSVSSKSIYDVGGTKVRANSQDEANTLADEVSGKNTERVRRYTEPEEGSESEYEREAGKLPDEFSESDENRIRSDIYNRNQDFIDSTNEVYDRLRGDIAERGQNSLGRQRSISSRSGLLGSARGEAQRKNVEGSIKQEEELNEARRQAELRSIFSDIDNRASQEIAAKRAEVAGQREAYVDFLKTQAESAKEQVKSLAGLGVEIDDLDEQDVSDLMKYTGYNEMTLRSIWNNSKPKEEQIKYEYKVTDGGKLLAYGVDPKTGELVTKDFQFDVPVELDVDEKITEVDGVPMIVRTENGIIKEVRPVEASGGSSSKKQKELDDQLEGYESVKTLAQELRDDEAEGKGAAVGAGFKKNVASLLPGIGPEAIAGTARASYEARVKTLIDTLASTNLDKLKGPMSDKDIEFLRKIGSSLDTNMKEKDFNAELDRIIKRMDSVIGTAQASGAKSRSAATQAKEEIAEITDLDTYYRNNPDQQDTVDELIESVSAENPDATEEEVEAYVLKLIKSQ